MKQGDWRSLGCAEVNVAKSTYRPPAASINFAGLRFVLAAQLL